MESEQKTPRRRVLFVDDDPNVLDGYRRLFRSWRNIWEISYESSATQALERIATEPFDVLVTDLQMPGMNGIELLERVVEINPALARIVLTGYGDARTTLQAADLAHQCLSKPCDPEQLREAVSHACAVQEIITSERLRAIIGSVRKLPAEPTVYHRLSRELARETADARSISAIIEQDVGLSAKLLQLVNSAFFGLRKPVSSLTQAVAMVGQRRLRDLVLATQVFDQAALGSGIGFSHADLQRQSLAVARLARRIALDLGVDEDHADQAFLGGLLHDFGILILAANWPKRYAALVVKAREKNAPLVLAEQAYLKITHAEAGAYLLGLWRIPPVIVEAVLFHHKPRADASVPVLSVCMADALLQPLLEDLVEEPARAIPEVLVDREEVAQGLERWRSWAAEVVEQVRDAPAF